MELKSVAEMGFGVEYDYSCFSCELVNGEYLRAHAQM